jgi:hypothetical protein
MRWAVALGAEVDLGRVDLDKADSLAARRLGKSL